MDDYITLNGFGFAFVFLLVLMRGFLLMFQDPINGSKPKKPPTDARDEQDEDG